MYPSDQFCRLEPGIYHVTRPKGPFRHHGLLCVDVLGPGEVVIDLPASGIRRSTLAEFGAGQAVHLERTRPADGAAALDRLRYMLGEGAVYSLLGFNCEHFVNYVLRGVKRSSQVDVTLSAFAGTLLLLYAVRQ